MNNKSIKHTVKNEDVLEIELENGKKVEGKILFTFEEAGDQFIFYEIEHDNNGEIQYVAYGAKLNEDNSISAISDDEWPIVERIYNEWIENNEEYEEEE